MQELMMVNAKPRADSLFRIGVLLLVLSLACPIAAIWIYTYLDPLPLETVNNIVNLKQKLGDLPKEITFTTGRDWHVLLVGITFGFLCLAAAKGILSQQASETKTYLEFGQRARYYERLGNVVELMLWDKAPHSEAEQQAVKLLSEKLINDDTFENKEKDKSAEEDSALGKLLHEFVKTAQSCKFSA